MELNFRLSHPIIAPIARGFARGGSNSMVQNHFFCTPKRLTQESRHLLVKINNQPKWLSVYVCLKVALPYTVLTIPVYGMVW